MVECVGDVASLSERRTTKQIQHNEQIAEEEDQQEDVNRQNLQKNRNESHKELVPLEEPLKE